MDVEENVVAIAFITRGYEDLLYERSDHAPYFGYTKSRELVLVVERR
jgi:hypothetical protein